MHESERGVHSGQGARGVPRSLASPNAHATASALGLCSMNNTLIRFDSAFAFGNFPMTGLCIEPQDQSFACQGENNLQGS